MKRLHTVYLYNDESEDSYLVYFKYSKGCPAKMYERNGDPGYPAEDSEIEILEVTTNGVKLTSEEIDKISESLENELWNCIDEWNETF